MTEARSPRARTPLAAAGLVAGFASSFLGIGGGLIMVPVLTLVFRFPLKRAIGTSLASIVVVAAVGVGAESWVKRENIHWAAAAVLTAGALAGSLLGGWMVRRLPTRALRWSLVGLLAIAAIRLSGLADSGFAAAPFAAWTEGSGPVVLLGLGLVSGVTSSLFGIGGGIVAVPGMTILFENFRFHAARATSLAMIVPTSALGAAQHHKLGHVEPSAVAALLPAAAAGAVLGVLTANRLPEAPLRWSFTAFLIYAAIQLARPRREDPSS